MCSKNQEVDPLFAQFITKDFLIQRIFRVLRNSFFRTNDFYSKKTEQIFARKEPASFSLRSLRPSDTSDASGSSFPESRSISIAHFSSIIQICLICNQISSCYFIDCQFINPEKRVTCFLLKNRTIYFRT